MTRTPIAFRLIAGLAFVFLYLPIVVLVIMSFNGSSNAYRMDGVSLRWYRELATDGALAEGVRNTVIVAASATALAVVIGTALAFGLARTVRSRTLDVVAVAPAIIPDVVQGLALLTFFALIAAPLGLPTVVAAHTVFATAFVVATVRARLATFDVSLEEAARDLGSGTLGALLRVVAPVVAPAIVAGALLAFTLSVDEFVIAYFTNGPSTPTLPIIVYSRVRFALTPEINALGALLVLLSFVALLAGARWVGVLGRRR